MKSGSTTYSPYEEAVSLYLDAAQKLGLRVGVPCSHWSNGRLEHLSPFRRTKLQAGG
ncbi:MAG: hypothetical protein ACRDQZ_19015 [Mycobacteriales bacterium]